MSAQLANYFGVKDGKGLLVTEVNENSPAAKADLKAGDVITEIDGKKVAEVNDLTSALTAKSEGTMVVKIIRKGAEKTINVTLEKPAAPRPAEPRPPVRRQGAVLYTPFYNFI